MGFFRFRGENLLLAAARHLGVINHAREFQLADLYDGLRLNRIVLGHQFALPFLPIYYHRLCLDFNRFYAFLAAPVF